MCRDGLAEAVGFLGLVCGSLAKIATDVILLAQTEVAEVSRAATSAGRGSSSTMPQKRNPIASEYVLAAARAVQALVPVMQGAMAQDHERATGPWQAELLALPQAFVLTHGALLHARAHRRGHGGRRRADAPQPRRDRRPDRGRGGDDGPRPASRPRARRITSSSTPATARWPNGIALADALLREPEVAAQLDRAAIERLTDPAGYLGSADAFIDRVLAAARAGLVISRNRRDWRPGVRCIPARDDLLPLPSRCKAAYALGAALGLTLRQRDAVRARPAAPAAGRRLWRRQTTGRWRRNRELTE